MKPEYYENDTIFIAAHHQPATLIDLALSRDIDMHRLLRGTRLFYNDVVEGHVRVSPSQYLQLYANCLKCLDADDTSFLLGQRLLPGHYGDASHTLQHSMHLRQALEQMLENRAIITPLLSPRLHVDDDQVYLYWIDAVGCDALFSQLVETCMTAVTALCRQLTTQVLPWRYHFSRSRPRHIEQFWVHLSEQVHFDQYIDVMILPKKYLFARIPGGSPTAGRIAEQACRYQRSVAGFQGGFLDQVYDYLFVHVREPNKLETVAQAFSMSAATFKRKLQKHGTHFQSLLDLVRMHVALYLYRVKGFGNEAVAEHLGFQDVTNLRRSFKRWTGVCPSAVR